MTKAIGQGLVNTEPFTDWLKANDRWGAFRASRNRHLAEGRSKGEAWELAAIEHGWHTEFTPPDEGEEPEGGPTDPRVERAMSLPDMDLERDLTWVYHNGGKAKTALDARNGKGPNADKGRDDFAAIVAEAPSGGAALLLEVVAEDPREFAKLCFRMRQEQQKKKTEQSKMHDDKRRTMKAVDDLLAERK